MIAQRPPDLRSALLAAFLAWAFAAGAQDFAVLGGVTQSDIPDARTYGWLVSYSRNLAPNWSASISYVNEGHVPSHHRDGHSAQLWAQTSAASPGIRFAAGAGPFLYFDTTVAEGNDDYRDAHGWGTLFSVTATWRSHSTPWFYQLRIDRVETRNNLDTTKVLLGVGYRLDQDGAVAAGTGGAARMNNEVVVFAGQTIVNSFESQSSVARSLEYRHAFGPVLRGSVGWINEGDSRLTRRDGLVAQAWLEPSFFNDRLTLGIGLGPYFAVEAYQGGEHHVLGLLTTTASYHFAQAWSGRFSWHRSVSRYDRDSDILLLGVGYRF